MDIKENSKIDVSRVEAFSDGVFAIAITLLVLDIRIPEVTDQQSLFEAMESEWTSQVAFLIGFFTILICWINHHNIFKYIQKNDGVLMVLNGLKLLVVSFTPFATALISKYFGTVHQQMAISIYTFNFFLMGLAMLAIWYYAYWKKLIVPLSGSFQKAMTRLYILASLLSGLIFILSFINTWMCLTLFIIMFLIFLIPKIPLSYFEKNT